MGSVGITRRVTRAIKIYPFIYTVIYIPCMFSYLIFDEDVCTWIDTLFLMSAMNVAFMVKLSYCVKLCKWHRLQCCLPLLPQPLIFVDNHIYCFGKTSAIINVWLAVAIALLTLINIYKMSRPRRNP